MPRSELAAFHCLFCRAPCAGWGSHALSDCAVVMGAVLMGFRAAAATLTEFGFHVQWSSPMRFYAGRDWRFADSWALLADPDALDTTIISGTAALTWSGLLWSRLPYHLAATVRSRSGSLLWGRAFRRTAPLVC